MRYSGSKRQRIICACLLFASVLLLMLNFIGFGSAPFFSVGASGVSPVKAFTFSFAAFAAGGALILVGILYILLFLACVALPIITGIKVLINRKYFSPLPCCVIGIVFGLLWLIAAVMAMTMGETFTGLFGGLLNLGSMTGGLMDLSLGLSGMGGMGSMGSLLGGTMTTTLSFLPTFWLILYLAIMIVTLILLKREKVVEAPAAPAVPDSPGSETIKVDDARGTQTIPSRRTNLQGVAVQIHYTDDSGTHVVKRQILTDSPLTIGRSERNKLVLVDGRTSGNHARLTYDDLDGLVIEDLDSTNGIQVNGETIMRKRKIGQNDSVRIGDCKLQFRVTGSLDDFDGERTMPAGDRYHEPIRLKLTFTDDSGPRTENLVLKDTVTIGRARDCEVFIDATTVTHRHARLMNLGGGRLAVADNDSSNGVIINGVRITEQTELGSGDVMRLGDVNVRVTITR